MTAHISIEELEALAKGDLPTAEATAFESHLQECASCQSELAWVRAEKELFARRQRPQAPAELWARIEARLDAGKPTVVVPRARRFNGQGAQWLGVAAAAAAMLTLISLSSGGVLHLRQGFLALLGRPGTNLPSAAPPTVTVIDVEQPPRSITLPVKGPVTLRLAAASADLEAHAGKADEVRIDVEDGEVQTLELRREPTGELRALFDQREILNTGHVRITLPPRSRLELYSASGSIVVSGVAGDVKVESPSGDINIEEAQQLDINTMSGDINLEQISGDVRIHTISGDVNLSVEKQPIGRVEFNSVSGSLELGGECGAACQVNAETISGDVQLHTDIKSSYTATFRSHSGDLHGPGVRNDDDEDAPPHGPKVSEKVIRIGGGAGKVRVISQSGDLHISHP